MSTNLPNTPSASRPAARPPAAPASRVSQPATKPSPSAGRTLAARLQPWRVGASALVASVVFFAAVQVSLRWESTGFESQGAVNVVSGQTYYGTIGINWSGDFVIRSANDEAQPPVTVAVSSLRTLTLTGEPASTTPWRLLTGLALSLVGALCAGAAVFMSKHWGARRRSS